MLFSKKRMRLTTTYQGKTDPEGWIVLDLKGMDLEGATQIYLSMEEIRQIQAAGDVHTDRLKQARSLLGGDLEDES